jgi:CheY-like chemotaxis protein
VPTNSGDLRPILVVDDDLDLRSAICEILADDGYDTRVFGSGRQALDFLRAGGRARLILLDLTMPDMSGWEFRDRQLRDAVLRDIPVVVLTATRSLDAQPIAVQEILYKPVELPELLGAVARNLAHERDVLAPRRTRAAD